MYKQRMIALFSIAAILTGCQYHGAVYSRYQHFGLRLKADPKTAIPISTDLGYDFSQVAVVPKHDIDSSPQGKGEVGSLVSTSSLVSNPPGTKPVSVDSGFERRLTKAEKAQQALETALDTSNNARKPDATPKDSESKPAMKNVFALTNSQPLLVARDALFSGEAAIIASVPKDTTVAIIQGDGQKFEITPKVSPKDRLSALALESVPEGLSTEQYNLEKLLAVVADRSCDKRGAYDEISNRMPKSFQDAYAKQKTDAANMFQNEDEIVAFAFSMAVADFIQDSGTEPWRHRHLLSVLSDYVDEKKLD